MTAPVRVLAALALGIALSGCAAGVKATPTEPLEPVVAPLTTALGVASATWVIVPMEHLNDPRNTFWQLFVLPRGAVRGSW